MGLQARLELPQINISNAAATDSRATLGRFIRLLEQGPQIASRAITPLDEVVDLYTAMDKKTGRHTFAQQMVLTMGELVSHRLVAGLDVDSATRIAMEAARNKYVQSCGDHHPVVQEQSDFVALKALIRHVATFAEQP